MRKESDLKNMAARLTAVIADDEEHICRELQYIIERDGRVKVIQVCHAGREALEAICRHLPDIAFLDIDMPGLNGIELGTCLRQVKKPPFLVYVTAFGQYAVEAFKVGARGYVLKPFLEQDILYQIDSAVDSFQEKKPVAPDKKIETGGLAGRINKIAVELDGKYGLLDQKDILMAYAQNRLVYLRANEQTYTTKYTLSELEEKLNRELFLRCHRNYIINLNRVKEVLPWFHSTFILLMDDGQTRIPVSRAHVARLKDVFSI